MLTQIKTLPKILVFSEIKYYIFSAVFVSLAIFIPWLGHQFHLAGPKFLLMHFFVLIAGFLFGWRTGLLVGLLSPLMSYSVSHLPAIIILPEIILELAAYGFFIGLLREKNVNIWTSLFLSMISGRIIRILFIFIFRPGFDPIGFLKISLPGIILQIVLIPLMIYLLQRFVFEKTDEQRI